MVKMDKNERVLGTFGNVTIYEMYGERRHRAKSSLTRKRVLESKAFEKTRKCASDMGRAAKIGSFIYKALPCDIKERWLYQAITGEAASLLYKGKAEQEVKEFLWNKYIESTGAKHEDATIEKTFRNYNLSDKQTPRKLRDVFYTRWECQGKTYYDFKRAWDRRGSFNKEKFRYILEVLQMPSNRG